jgi:hypothetical protein
MGFLDFLFRRGDRKSDGIGTTDPAHVLPLTISEEEKDGPRDLDAGSAQSDAADSVGDSGSAGTGDDGGSDGGGGGGVD